MIGDEHQPSARRRQRRDPPPHHRRCPPARRTHPSRRSWPPSSASAATRCAKRCRRSPTRASSRSSRGAALVRWSCPTSGRAICSRCARSSKASSRRWRRKRRTLPPARRDRAGHQRRARRRAVGRARRTSGPEQPLPRPARRRGGEPAARRDHTDLTNVIQWMYTRRLLERGQWSWDEHAAITRAVADQDADRAAELARAHIRNARDAYVSSAVDATACDRIAVAEDAAARQKPRVAPPSTRMAAPVTKSPGRCTGTRRRRRARRAVPGDPSGCRRGDGGARPRRPHPRGRPWPPRSGRATACRTDRSRRR